MRRNEQIHLLNSDRFKKEKKEKKIGFLLKYTTKTKAAFSCSRNIYSYSFLVCESENETRQLGSVCEDSAGCVPGFGR